jgi:RNA polymerase sigma-70 factor (sigma-E family)
MRREVTAVAVLDGEAEREFREFARAETPALMRAAYQLTGDSHHAQDLVQSTLVNVALHWRAATGHPQAYARKSRYHQAVSWWRWRGRRPETPFAVVPDATPGDDDDRERRLVVRAALARLTPKQRAVLVLRYFEDLPESETARLLGCSIGTVKSQTRHALSRLRALAPELGEVFDVTEVPR